MEKMNMVRITVTDPFSDNKTIVVLVSQDHSRGLTDGMVVHNCSDEHKDLADHLDGLEARGLVLIVTEREVEIVKDLQLNPAYRDWQLLSEADRLGLVVYHSDDTESCVGWTPTAKFDRIISGLWQTFTFRSEAISPEGQDTEEVYGFHPSVKVSQWEGVRFCNGKADCENTRNFHSWLDRLNPQLWREVSTERSKSVMDRVRELED